MCVCVWAHVAQVCISVGVLQVRPPGRVASCTGSNIIPDRGGGERKYACLYLVFAGSEASYSVLFYITQPAYMYACV